MSRKIGLTLLQTWTRKTHTNRMTPLSFFFGENRHNRLITSFPPPSLQAIRFDGPATSVAETWQVCADLGGERGTISFEVCAGAMAPG